MYTYFVYNEKNPAGSVTIRIQTLDLKTSPSALQTGQKKKFGLNICEDSNLIQSRYTIL